MAKLTAIATIIVRTQSFREKEKSLLPYNDITRFKSLWWFKTYKDAEVEVVEVLDEDDVPVGRHLIRVHRGSARLLLEHKLQGKSDWD